MKQTLVLLAALAILLGTLSFHSNAPADNFSGAWALNSKSSEQVVLFMDGYFTFTGYDQALKRFVRTCGGTYKLQNDKCTINYEFSSDAREQAGSTVTYIMAIKEGKLVTDLTGELEGWKRIDDGKAPLAGLWAITARKQDGALQPIHQTGTRKTVKLLTGTRFQWAAIDPGTNQFMGTGGGTYTFKDGKYTEQIEFFSRDSSRVGSSLSFNGSVEEGNWHHSGLSSRGEPIYEVWSRKKK
jgi:hypothetical protein